MQRTEDAEAAQERADAAWAAVDEVPVEALEDEVASAEQALEDARQDLADAQADVSTQSRLASSSVSLIATLPADAGQLSDQGWALPVAGRITDGFGPRPVKPLAGVNDFHRGTDLAATCETPVFAATDGVVVEAAPNGSLGNWILIDHGSGVETGYAHLAAGGTFVAAGRDGRRRAAHRRGGQHGRLHGMPPPLRGAPRRGRGRTRCRSWRRAASGSAEPSGQLAGLTRRPSPGLGSRTRATPHPLSPDAACGVIEA